MQNGFLLLLAFYCVTLLALTPLMASWLTGAMSGQLSRGPLGRVEAWVYRLGGVEPDAGMSWRGYALSVLLFNGLGVLVVYGLQRMQGWLPLNPAALGNVLPDSAFNTAVSFVTNTNWQGYGGESTMSYLTQMLGLGVQNYLSAGTGIAVAFALIRGFGKATPSGLGNFWVDIYRVTCYVLLPVCLVYALVLVSQGVVQTLGAPVTVSTLEGGPGSQTLAMGPAASQVAIKMLGTNGGGFFNANGAHPFENPNALSNLLQMLSIFLIPAGLCVVFGRMMGDVRQGWALWVAMAVLFVVSALATNHFEQQGNPTFPGLGVDQSASADQPGGNMEGKEARFGIAATSLFATITTSASCGAVNGMHDSFTPMGGLVPLWLIQLGEVVFGGVGAGLYGMLIFAIVAVFVAGLMIGRTPEYQGKKIDAFEMKMASIALLIPPFLVLAGTAVAVALPAGRASVFNPGAHGFTEVLYGLSSAANNNGSAFGGLSANTPFYNVLLAVAMWLGRFGVIVPVLAIAGSLSRKRVAAQTAGSLPTHGPLFIALLLATVVVVGALTYLPALALGPIAEQFALLAQ